MTAEHLLKRRERCRVTRTNGGLASASYVGARGYDLPTFVDVNLGLTGASKTFTILGGTENGQTFTVAQYAKAISTQASMLREESSVKSEYSALVLQVNR